jgi:hypothetical protein
MAAHKVQGEHMRQGWHHGEDGTMSVVLRDRPR